MLNLGFRSGAVQGPCCAGASIGFSIAMARSFVANGPCKVSVELFERAESPLQGLRGVPSCNTGAGWHFVIQFSGGIAPNRLTSVQAAEYRMGSGTVSGILTGTL